MRENPTGASLLQAACTLLREDILKALPAENRYNALMITNAMSIAMRQLEQGDAPEQKELQALRQLLGIGDEDKQTPMRKLLVTLNRQLALRVRNGDADPGSALHNVTFAHLRQTSHQRLLESNPKVLKESF